MKPERCDPFNTDWRHPDAHKLGKGSRKHYCTVHLQAHPIVMLGFRKSRVFVGSSEKWIEHGKLAAAVLRRPEASILSENQLQQILAGFKGKERSQSPTLVSLQFRLKAMQSLFAWVITSGDGESSLRHCTHSLAEVSSSALLRRSSVLGVMASSSSGSRGGHGLPAAAGGCRRSRGSCS